ncbi:hypothetical protein [Asticcacaulis solisilvae]|uniref:hypothetical protein n=1 Tax=Asticcacaulis solisilvae TaxID=1217274 RepID=UPI003FD78C6F
MTRERAKDHIGDPVGDALKDSDLAELFAQPLTFEDAPRFEAKVVRGLSMRLWMRHWLVVLAGFVGGIYALAQIVRVPDLSAQSLHSAAVRTDHTLNAGIQAMDVAGKTMSNFTDQWGHYLGMMQTPAFFWVSFSLCLMFVGLYYAYSQEEAL